MSQLSRSRLASRRGVAVRALVLALTALLMGLLASSCITATALIVVVDSELDCTDGASVVLVGARQLSDLTNGPTRSSKATQCTSAGGTTQRGNVVLTPPADGDPDVAFAVMSRVGGGDASTCLADPSTCIIAKRQFSLIKHQTLTMQVELRRSCVGIPCGVSETCDKGRCVPARCETVDCSANLQGGNDDASLASLALSGTSLAPTFAPGTLSYGAHIGTYGVFGAPSTSVTATTTASGATLTVQNLPATSGVATPPIAIAEGPNTLTVRVTSASGKVTRDYLVAVLGTPFADVKASNTRTGATFGVSVTLSADGSTLAVGSAESSNSKGVNGNQLDTSAASAGAVYVFVRSAGTWTQQAYLKASNTASMAFFGASTSLAADGNTLVVGAYGEASGATGIDGNQLDTSAPNSGAAYVFVRTGTTWNQGTYLKASNTRAGANFGLAVAIASDGNTLAVGARSESSNATGINGNQADASRAGAGAVYVFARAGSGWAQQAYLKASFSAPDSFGSALAISADGTSLAVGAVSESSKATGIDGDATDVSASQAGAVYLFVRSNVTWQQQAYIKASNTKSGAGFGGSVSLSASGDILAVSASGETGGGQGVNPSQQDAGLTAAGAVYLFTRTGTKWAQDTYLKASNSRTGIAFGSTLALDGNGARLAVGAFGDSSNATGVGGDQQNQSAPLAGAAYVFEHRAGAWTQVTYLKAANSRPGADFGIAALSSDGSTLAVAAAGDSSSATGINGDQSSTAAPFAGAVYVY